VASAVGIPVACIAWTVTHEEVFREPRQYCQKNAPRHARYCGEILLLIHLRILLYHYVAAGVLIIARFKLLYVDWRGYLFAFFALVWIANQYMSIYNRLRLDIKHEQVEIKRRSKGRHANR